MKKKPFLAFIISLVLVGALSPTSSVRAQYESPFGGLVSFYYPCTCTANLWIWFTPLYLGGPAVITGPMVYSPYATIPYANYQIGIPGTYHLGSYLPGTQACWMYIGYGCIIWSSVGLMTKVGTN